MSTTFKETTARTAWLFLAFLVLLNVINFIDRQLITSLQIPLREDPELKLTNVQNQWLAGYAFSIVYSVAGLVLGGLADRRHRPRLVAAGLLIWSTMTAASGLARNFEQMALARVFVAIGEATLTPASVAMVGDLFRPRQRSLATGLYYLGIPIGASLSMIISNFLWPIPWIGWRGCFLSLGLIGLTMVVALLFLPDPKRGGMESTADEAKEPASLWSLTALLPDLFRALRTAPALALTLLGAVLVNISVGTTWLDISWLNAERGFSKQGAAIFLGLGLLIGGSAGNVIGGWLGDRLSRRTSGGRLLALLILQVTILPFAIAFKFLPGDLRPILFVCCVVGSLQITFMYGPVLSTIHDMTPVRLRATMVAFLLIGLNVTGASLGSIVAAWVTEKFGSYTWGIFLTAQVSLLAIPVFVVAFRRYDSDLERLARRQELDSLRPVEVLG